jgi:hypothetical protein
MGVQLWVVMRHVGSVVGGESSSGRMPGLKVEVGFKLAGSAGVDAEKRAEVASSKEMEAMNHLICPDSIARVQWSYLE